MVCISYVMSIHSFKYGMLFRHYYDYITIIHQTNNAGYFVRGFCNRNTTIQRQFFDINNHGSSVFSSWWFLTPSLFGKLVFRWVYKLSDVKCWCQVVIILDSTLPYSSTFFRVMAGSFFFRYDAMTTWPRSVATTCPGAGICSGILLVTDLQKPRFDD